MNKICVVLFWFWWCVMSCSFSLNGWLFNVLCRGSTLEGLPVSEDSGCTASAPRVKVAHYFDSCNLMWNKQKHLFKIVSTKWNVPVVWFWSLCNLLEFCEMIEEMLMCNPAVHFGYTYILCVFQVTIWVERHTGQAACTSILLYLLDQEREALETCLEHTSSSMQETSATSIMVLL